MSLWNGGVGGLPLTETFLRLLKPRQNAGEGTACHEAADVLGMRQSKLSKMLRGQFRGISEAKMLECLARLGRPLDTRRKWDTPADVSDGGW
ncbi:XRE family transcriptional regulator [Xylella fastidiosa]|jgi:hypothetical protein|uniref:XRE family transcriptional regulator n=1 Tax=Xylella fastidiosa TaxID=2371 RepID=UPI00021442B4|nr:XRE family transcriptional regulator [Xylella fastidiosa]AIC13648.1 hypothetical protein P303_04030 [Xylella fastidiosa MUL0034]EGO80780.1 hypothetical protein XFEB_02351 [Xylella fastidiosa EB92.1]SHH14452.1 Helix-turn-helix domain-containing protein [Xylella fastidiosa]